ncbi:MAG: cofactor-independent phosphoglycerate mutase [Desulfobacterales bacterium C00003060]|nr:MAG: cofactor-independent phosphoglycerate mutase [Desulfobacterales bacterium C00003060]
MKYIILVGDGMGDYPIAELGGKTPLAAAHTPHMDWIADHGELGLAQTLPQGCETGSDTANLSVLGYNPKKTLTRRAPLEAASLGVHLSDTDVAFRCNLVTLSTQNGVLTMDDYSAGHISSDEAREIIEDLDRALGDESIRFYPGVSYRHLMVWHGGAADIETMPPHDITGKAVKPYLDRMASRGVLLLQLMERASKLLKDHPVNMKRVEKGSKPANHIWFWGQGHAPVLEAFKDKTGLTGAMISAVDLLKGIGVYAGLEVIKVPGATGYFDTDYEAKATYALAAIKGVDLVYVHVEAPDEAGHAGLLDKKVSAIEAFDSMVVGKVLDGMKGFSEYRVMVTTDHYTPISVRTHTTEPVPFAICGTGISIPPQGSGGFSEENAEARGVLVADGSKLINRLIRFSK